VPAIRPEEVPVKIETLVVGALQTNCYILYDELGKEAIIVDPGADAEAILDTVRRLGLTVTHVIDTHGHFDHINANGDVVKATGAVLAVHPDDAGMLTNPPRIFELFAPQSKASPAPTLLLREGDTVKVGRTLLRVLHTPGHSPGSISLLSEADSLILSGDVLFQMSIGRTDFPGGSTRTLLRSIRERLLVLPDKVVVCPGHGPMTTIGFERENNPFLS
jgi:hydroxyacylglutathione hydrolase